MTKKASAAGDEQQLVGALPVPPWCKPEPSSPAAKGGKRKAAAEKPEEAEKPEPAAKAKEDKAAEQPPAKRAKETPPAAAADVEMPAAAAAAAAAPAAAAAAAPAPTRKELEKLTVAKLKEKLTASGVSDLSGLKKDLVARLLAATHDGAKKAAG